MLWTIVIIVVAVILIAVVAVLGFAAIQPDHFRVQRSAAMKAMQEKVFAQIDDFHNWGSWSPWEKLDPAMKKIHSGPASGKGAIYEWEGNKQVGKGRMEITESSSPSKIVIKLDFFKPFEAHNTADFVLEAQGDSTNLIWGMNGQKPFMFKVMGLFFSMDKMIGKDFEKGLANLKGIVEK